jgi:hypothetical protein
MSLLTEPFILDIQIDGATPFQVKIVSPYTSIVGANATGKSRLLRGIRTRLLNQLGNDSEIVYLTSSRLAGIDQFRLDYDGNRGSPRYEDMSLGGAYNRATFKRSEGVNRMLFRLEERPDLLLKVQTRLEHLFGRSISLDWDDGQFRPRFLRTDGNGQYTMSREASGLLHIVGMIAAVHDPEVKILLIDEPEISLHPQYQSFLFRELRKAAGDYRNQQGKKIVIVATHSPTMILLETSDDLPGLLFCNHVDQAPMQISPDEGALNGTGIKDFVRTSLRRHKEVLFSARPILVEGDSDLRILQALELRLGIELDTSGAYPIALQGKGKLSDAMRLFALMGKQPFAVTDLDALTDTGSVPLPVAQNPKLIGSAQAQGHKNFASYVKTVRDGFCQQIEKD